MTDVRTTVPHVFISYKRGADPDEALATALHEVLAAAGCSVFFDREILPSADWQDEIDNNLERTDVFVLLLSAAAADSVHVVNELDTAHRLSTSTRPDLRIVPIRVGYTGQPRFNVRSILLRLNELKWNGDTDTPSIVHLLLGLISAAGFTIKRDVASTMVSAVSAFAEDLQQSLAALADAAVAERGRMDESLFLISKLDFIYKALLLRVTVVDPSLVPSKEASDLQSLRNDTAETLNHSRDTGKDSRLVTSYEGALDVIDVFLDIAERRRVLAEARGIALRQSYQDSRIRSFDASKDKKFETISEAATAFFDQMGDMKRREKQVRLEFEDKDRALRSEFWKAYSDAHASARVALRSMASDRGWPDDLWALDSDSDAWTEARKKAETDDRAGLNAVFDAQVTKRRGEPWAVMSYVHNLIPKDEAGKERHARLAVSAAGRVPGAAIHDEVRFALVLIAARRATEVLEARRVKPLSAEDQDRAAHVERLWAAMQKYNPTFAVREMTEARLFTLCEARHFSQALDLVTAQEPNTKWSPKMTRSALWAAAGAGEVDHAFKWLEYGLQHVNGFDVAGCRTDPELADLRADAPDRFAKLTTVSCEVVAEHGMMAYDVLLRNTSPFPLDDVVLRLSHVNPIRGQLSTDRITSGSSCKWTWVGLNGNASNTTLRPPYTMQCRQGEVRFGT